MSLAPVAAQAPSAASAVTIHVELDSTKADGRAWDAGGNPPDVALCVTAAGATKCLPSGASLAAVTGPQCRDALQCTFADITVPAGSFHLQVIDVDVMANDLAGEGDCQPGATCRAGQATVTVTGGAPPVAVAPMPGAIPIVPIAAPPGTAPGAFPPAATSTIARIRQAIAAHDFLVLRGLLEDDGEFLVGPGLTASTAQAAVEAWRANPATLADLDRILAMPCSAEEDDGMTIITCPRITSDEYEGPMAVLGEMDDSVYRLVSFERP